MTIRIHISGTVRPSSFRRSGFTLLEILLALALVGLVFVALNTFIFSMGELWGQNTDVRLFDQHVRNVTRFLEGELRSAALPPAAGSTSNTDGSADAPIAAKDIRASSGLTEPLLTFTLPAGSRLISWPERPLPDVVCSLAVRDRQGLMLLWHSRLEKRFDQDAPRETVISPMVTGMTYDYYDADFKRWKTETQLQKDNSGQVTTPQRIRLKFAYGKLTRESIVQLPAPVEGLPHL